jgi:hypothetical protein
MLMLEPTLQTSRSALRHFGKASVLSAPSLEFLAAAAAAAAAALMATKFQTRDALNSLHAVATV